MKLVSIITVNYNQAAVTEALLNSIQNQNNYEALEVIVVDNGSKENRVDSWRRQYPQFSFIRSDINLGFAGGNNLGIRQAKGDYLFLINNDTEVTTSLIGTLVDTMNQHPMVGIISPKIRYYNQPEMIQYVGFTPMNYYTARNNCIGQFETDKGQYDHMCGATGFAHGAAMMVRREALAKAGPMAENYFLYYEEMDWCDHIRRTGYQVWVNTDALIYHKESVSVGARSAMKEFFMNRNRILFIRRNCSGLTIIFFMAYFLLVVTPRNILTYIKNKEFGFIGVLFRAIWWNFTNSINSSKLGFTIKQ